MRASSSAGCSATTSRSSSRRARCAATASGTTTRPSTPRAWPTSSRAPTSSRHWRRALQELALAAYRAVDAPASPGSTSWCPMATIYISEMNTIPGFTATSMFPKQAELAGIGFGELIDRLIELGLDRAREQGRRSTDEAPRGPRRQVAAARPDRARRRPLRPGRIRRRAPPGGGRIAGRCSCSRPPSPASWRASYGPWHAGHGAGAHRRCVHAAPAASQEILDDYRGVPILAVDRAGLRDRLAALPDRRRRADRAAAARRRLQVAITEKAPAFLWRTQRAVLVGARDGTIIAELPLTRCCRTALAPAAARGGRRASRRACCRSGTPCPPPSCGWRKRLTALDPRLIGSRASATRGQGRLPDGLRAGVDATRLDGGAGLLPARSARGPGGRRRQAGAAAGGHPDAVRQQAGAQRLHGWMPATRGRYIGRPRARGRHRPRSERRAAEPTPMWLPLIGLALGIALGLVLNVSVSPDLARYSAVGILAGLDSVLGAVRAELDAHYDNRVFLSGFITNALVAVGADLRRRSAGDRPVPGGAVRLRAAHLPKRGPHPAPLPVGSGAGRIRAAGARGPSEVAWTGRRCWSASMPARRR